MFAVQSAVLLKEDVFRDPPFASCHAATIEESHGCVVAAWFAGSREGADDVGIWVARREKGAWTRPKEVEVGKDRQGRAQPCWNPVLFQPRRGPLLLFFKVGPDPVHWWGMMASSPDGGLHWLRAVRLPEGFLGPIKNRPLETPAGTILCPSSTEGHGWQVHFEFTANNGGSWSKTPSVNDGKSIRAIQPSLLDLGKGHLRAVGRTQEDRVFQTDSSDYGRTWGPMTLGDLPNNNSGLDATTLSNKTFLMVCNNVTRTPGEWSGRRSPLSVKVSSDAVHWHEVLTLEDEPGEEFSYPTVIQTRDGLVHVVYTWKRKTIKHVVIDPAKIPQGSPKG